MRNELFRSSFCWKEWPRFWSKKWSFLWHKVTRFEIIRIKMKNNGFRSLIHLLASVRAPKRPLPWQIVLLLWTHTIFQLSHVSDEKWEDLHEDQHVEKDLSSEACSTTIGLMGAFWTVFRVVYWSKRAKMQPFHIGTSSRFGWKIVLVKSDKNRLFDRNYQKHKI